MPKGKLGERGAVGGIFWRVWWRVGLINGDRRIVRSGVNRLCQVTVSLLYILSYIEAISLISPNKYGNLKPMGWTPDPRTLPISHCITSRV